MSQKYIERDVSWLHFNHRVLQEATDSRNPLYERIKFLAIYSSNLDEFFRVRVPSLRSLRKYRKRTGDKSMETKPGRALKEIRRLVKEQQEEFGRIFRREIVPELEQHGIRLLPCENYNEEQQAFAKKFFEEKLQEKLQSASSDAEELFLANKALYFAIQWEEDRPYTFVRIPTEELPRFVELPCASGKALTFLDDLLRFNLADAFPDRKAVGVYAVKLSRDADLNIDDEFSGDLIKKIKASLEEREYGHPSRFLYDAAMPKDMLRDIRKRLGLSKYELVPGARYHNFNDFFAFPDPTRNPKLHRDPLPPLPHPELEHCESVLEAVRQKDRVLHFPYQKFDYLTQLMEEAIADPHTREIKITLYRVASDSAVCHQLLRAQQAGKAVTVFVEAKARFDEESNLLWGERLQKAGATVIYSYPGIKVHTKLLLIVRRLEEQIEHLAYIGTGNFNEKTAKLYCDHALLTADPRLADEVARVFALLEKGEEYPFEHLLVAPRHLRPGFLQLVEREIALAKAGKEAYLILKMNSLESREMVEKLYEASRAGVNIQLIVRGICSLAPGVEGQSENIRAHSIVDRFLEHARVYIFGNDGREKMYIASADWMTRNLKRRVEVAAPIYDPEVYRQIRRIIDLQLADNSKARLLQADCLNDYRERKEGEKEVRAQMDTYAFLSKEVNNRLLDGK